MNHVQPFYVPTGKVPVSIPWSPLQQGPKAHELDYFIYFRDHPYLQRYLNICNSHQREKEGRVELRQQVQVNSCTLKLHSLSTCDALYQTFQE